MNKAGKILSVSPKFAIPGGEVIIECEGFETNLENGYACCFDGQRAKLVGVSANRVIAIVPESFDTHEVEIYLESGADQSESKPLRLVKSWLMNYISLQIRQLTRKIIQLF